MKKYLALFCLILLYSLNLKAAANDSHAGHIDWKTNYSEALKTSATSGKPVILFFTGSDWCGWCTKLENEVLNTDEFAQLVGDKFIFVKLDFPLYKQQDTNLAAANKQLQEKYEVRGFPALIIIDSSERKIGVTGYRANGPKLYANHLLEKVASTSNKQ